MSSGTSLSAYDQSVRNAGLTGTHRIILAGVPDGSRVLELGPSSGYMTRVLAEHGCRVDAIEFNAADAALAAPHCVTMVVGSLEEEISWASIHGPYDVAIMADVLEHLRDPGPALKRVHAVLARDGFALISLPNIAHWRTRFALLWGRFDYTEMGVMDRTHLRFFTLKTATAMIEEAGFTIDRFLIPPSSGTLLKRSFEWLRQSVPTLFSFHFIFMIRPRRG